MANRDFGEVKHGMGGRSGSIPATGKKGPSATVKEGTAGWGGLPGKSGPNRSGGVIKVKQYPKSEGL